MIFHGSTLINALLSLLGTDNERTLYFAHVQIEKLIFSEEKVSLSKTQIILARLAKMCILAYADSEGPDQPAHPRSLIRAFPVRLQNHWLL